MWFLFLFGAGSAAAPGPGGGNPDQWVNPVIVFPLTLRPMAVTGLPVER